MIRRSLHQQKENQQEGRGARENSSQPNTSMQLVRRRTSRPRYAYGKNVAMNASFEPGGIHVISGRGRQSYKHAGNKRYRLMISMHMYSYREARTKLDKSVVVISIVDAFRSVRGGFVRKMSSGGWVDIGDQIAREKTGHALRDAISAKIAEGSTITQDFEEVVSADQLMRLDPDGLDELEQLVRMGKLRNNPAVAKILASPSDVGKLSVVAEPNVETTVAPVYRQHPTKTVSATQESTTLTKQVTRLKATSKSSNEKIIANVSDMAIAAEERLAPQSIYDDKQNSDDMTRKITSSGLVEPPTFSIQSSFHMVSDASLTETPASASFVFNVFSDDGGGGEDHHHIPLEPLVAHPPAQLTEFASIEACFASEDFLSQQRKQQQHHHHQQQQHSGINNATQQYGGAAGGDKTFTFI